MTLGSLSGKPIDLAERKSTFDQFIDRTDGCWIWTGFRTAPDGYGRLQLTTRRIVLAHRAVYTALVGPIPAGMVLDHLCRVKLCVNPAHLEVVTQRENMRRFGALKTHCPKGHAYDEANTRMYRGMRYCRACQRLVDEGRRRIA